MNSQELYNTMFRRKSVRKYAPDPLPSGQIDSIRSSLAEIPPLTPDAQVQIDFLSPTQMTRAITAPHYAVSYAQKERLSMLEAGYRLQFLGLSLFSQGIGSCYNGMAKPHSNKQMSGQLSAQMVMALGTPLEDSRRTGPSAFDRKPLADIASEDVPLFIAEAVRVAPSAINAQPWFLSGSRSEVEVYYSPRGLKAKLASGMAYVDMGIALCHLRIAAEKQGMAYRFDFAATPTAVSTQKRELICKVFLS